MVDHLIYGKQSWYPTSSKRIVPKTIDVLAGAIGTRANTTDYDQETINVSQKEIPVLGIYINETLYYMVSWYPNTEAGQNAFRYIKSGDKVIPHY